MTDDGEGGSPQNPQEELYRVMFNEYDREPHRGPCAGEPLGIAEGARKAATGKGFLQGLRRYLEERSTAPDPTKSKS